MKKRNAFLVFLLTCITCGFYGLYRYIATKDEMNTKGAGIPTAFLLIIPIANLFWLWKYSKGVEKVTGGKSGAAVTFCLLFFLGVIGMAITQSALNKVAA